MLSSYNTKKLICVTWEKVAHSLFDYESESVKKSISQIKNGGFLKRNNETFETVYQETLVDEGFFLTGGVQINQEPPPDAICSFIKDSLYVLLSKDINDEYEYNKENLEIVQNKLWYLIEQKETKGIKTEYLSSFKYNFRLNDIVRFGRVQFIVRYLNIKNQNSNKIDKVPPLYLPNNINNIKDSKENDNSQQCAVCKKKETDKNNPVLKICPCEKSPYLHISCLKKAIMNSNDFGYKEESFENNKLKLIKVYNFICPYCDEPYNAIAKKYDREYNILPYNKPGDDSNYLILESLNFSRENIFTAVIIIFLFPTKKEEYFLGRGHESTFKLSDISISRVHCRIAFDEEKNKFVLEDLGSKFGTLLLARENINIKDFYEDNLKVQIGNSVVWIKNNDESDEDNK